MKITFSLSSLSIVFIILKLTNVINWSWVWVLSPIWISVVFTIFIYLLVWLVFILKYIKFNRKIKKSK